VDLKGWYGNRVMKSRKIGYSIRGEYMTYVARHKF